MKKTFRLFGIFTMILLSCLVLAVCNNSSGGGEDEDSSDNRDGLSEATAFLVNNAEELGYVGRGSANPEGYKNWDFNKNYKQTADIDLSGIANWTPIGNDRSFEGTYDGDGYAIKNLKIDTMEYSAGLFASATNCFSNSIKNIALIDCDITGDYYIGGIVGRGSIIIENCYVTGIIRGISVIGGIVGYYFGGGGIKNCYTTCDVINSGTSVSSSDGGFGGIVGTSEYNNVAHTGVEGLGIITNCFATGIVTGRNSIGGIAGNSDGTIRNCMALNKTVTSLENLDITIIKRRIGKIIGINYDTATNNYGRSDMGIGYTGSRHDDIVDGDPVTKTQAESSTWWTTAAWDAVSPWDWTTVWNLPSGGKLPTLKVFDGKQTQNPVIIN